MAICKVLTYFVVCIFSGNFLLVNGSTGKKKIAFIYNK